MSSEWPTVQLSDCAEFQEGYVNPSQRNSDFFDGPIKWLRAVDLNDSIVSDTTRTLSEKGFRSAGKSALLFEPGSLAISKSGTIGRLGILEDYMCGNRAVINIRVNHSICDKYYIFYVLKSKRAEIESLATGSVQKNLYTSVLGSMELDLPPLETQKAIARQLWSLDKKIQINHQINQTLEQMAQAIFKSWFVDFEPVKAKIAALEAGGSEEDALLAAMQAISGNGEAELTRLQSEQPEQYAELCATAELFPSAMQDSELGEIPEGWESGTLSDIASFSSNRIPKHELTLETYISTENMLENKKGVCPASSLPSSASVPGFEPGEILISNIRPYFKKIWLANISGGRSPDVLGFSPKHKGTNEYLFNLLYQDCFFDYMMLTSKGAKMPRGDKKAIMQFATATPPIDLMRHFSEHVKSFYLLATSQHRESESLASVRDSLLPKLLSGELAVSDDENQLMAESISPLQEVN
ncbi:MAG: restriction endonuclease subunit S [Gammaproteobacteria bacterium]|nr:restriction endonuclease subunit S [Gammaproteobacteria bacterium]